MTTRWAFMQRIEVPCLAKPLEALFVRWRLIQTPAFGIYVHRFDNADDRTFHDHPWNFRSFVLKGGYLEATPRDLDNPTEQIPVFRYVGPRRGFRSRFNHKRATDLHYIRSLVVKPTWTIVLVGRRQRDWGYVDDDGWTRFDLHENARRFDAAMAARKMIVRP